MKKFLAILLSIITSFQIPLLAQEEEFPGIYESLIEVNRDVEIISPKSGDVFELGAPIEVIYRNNNSDREYVYSVHYCYIIPKQNSWSLHANTEDISQELKPEQEGTILLQLFYYEKGDTSPAGNGHGYKYATEILVLGIGMDIPEYWLERYKKDSTEEPTPPKPITVDDPILDLTLPPNPQPEPTPKPNPPITKPKEEKPKEEVVSGKPFIFPFTKPVGVSQWHGNTAFQKPHTGIDFSVAKEETRAIGNGTVVGKGYDTYYGECHSGGNFLTIQHENGMYSVYFHLEQSYVKVGNKVKKGEMIAKTGNSGSWNCQPLAYHLHFETRKSRSQSTHVNPVEYIEQDWNLIPTANYKKYPGRLTGENPHPGS